MKKTENNNENDIRISMRESALKITLDRYRKKRIIFDAQFLREMYELSLENYRMSSAVYSHVKVNPFEIAKATDVMQFLCEFHLMNANGLPEQKVVELQADNNYKEALARDIGKAMFFSQHILDEAGAGVNKSNPLIIFPSVLYNYLLSVMNNLESRNVFLGNKRSVLAQLYKYILLQLQSVLSLLSINVKDAVCLWRNLHETECIATILYTNDEKLTDEFLYFQKFAFIDDFDSDKPEVVEVSGLYSDFKKNYREMKATRDEFREKGWLRLANGFSAENGFNFKRGLQPLANQSERYAAYRNASKIVHPSGITFNFPESESFVFVYKQILLTTTNLLNQISGLCGEDKPDIFDREASTLLDIINSYFVLYVRALSIQKNKE